MEIDFSPHIEEIKRALENEIDENSIISDLKRLLEYRVPLSEAKRSLIKKYGGSEKNKVRKLKDIVIGEHNIEVTGNILEVSQKTINIDNTERTIFSGIICDETSSRSFTAWSDFALNAGDVITISRAYVRNWQECPEINIGLRSKVTKLTTKIRQPESCELIKLAELKNGDYYVHTRFTILNLESHEINTKDGSRTIIEGIAADEDTKLPFTAWMTAPEIASGNTIEVRNAYVRSFRGVPTLNINETSILTELEETIEYKRTEKLKIGDVILKTGAYDLAVEGNILSIRPGSGLIYRCSECSRVMQKGICRIHGRIEEKIDMRIKAIIDDGTGAMMLVLDSTLTQRISGITIDDAQKIARSAMSQKVVEDEIKRRVLGKKFMARGNMSRGEFGITLVAADILKPTESVRDQASELQRRIMISYG